MKVALDTSVLAYAEGTNGAEMKKVALRLVPAAAGGLDRSAGASAGADERDEVQEDDT